MNKYVLLIWIVFMLLQSLYSQQQPCITQNQLDSKLAFAANNISNSPNIFFVYTQDKSFEIQKLNIQKDTICIKNSNETPDSNYIIYIINQNRKITKKVVKYEEISDKINEFDLQFLQTSIKSNNESILNFNLTKKDRFLFSIVVFFVSSIVLFIIFRKTVDWATSAKAELNRYKDARYKYIADKIDSRFKYIRQIDI